MRMFRSDVPLRGFPRLKRLLLLCLALAGTGLHGEGQPSTTAASRLTLQVRPAVDFPLADSSFLFGLGGSVLVGAKYDLPLPHLFVSGGLGYDYHAAAPGIPRSVSVGSASVGTGLWLGIPWLTVELSATGGFFFSFLNDFSASGGNPFLGWDADIVLLPGPWHVNLGAMFRYDFGQYMGIKATAGVSYDLVFGNRSAPARTLETLASKPKPLEATPKKQPAEAPASAVELRDGSFDDIYPVFRTYYAAHPLGTIVLRNGLDKPITGIKVTFQIKEFMSDPTDCPAPAQLGPGKSTPVDLFGLFLPTILQTTEKTKAQAKIDVEYTLNGQVQHQSIVQVIPVLDRNATTWADNRRAAAFVTAKDPAVLIFSKNVNSMVKGKVRGAVNPNLLTAIAFFEALQLYGLTYSLDPVPTLTTSKQVADYIQFPRQTLQYKGGKCSDFSVLYAALLESVGIETAFITIPGHIFMAFSTGLDPAEARKTFSRADELVIRAGKSWIPVEVTESAGFLKAWQDGAKEWRENLSREQADFYPIHEAWTLYEPVGLSGAEVAVSLPPSEKVVERYLEAADRFVDQEIFPKVAALSREMEKSQDPRVPGNALGVLYARYGRYDRAAQQFEKLLAKEEYVPALLNLGNIYSLSDQKEKALQYYNRAYSKEHDNPRVLLAVARVNHDLENYYQVRKVYAVLKSKDPELAAKFSYLDLKGEEATRAAEISGVNEVVLWVE